jgi:hypothetical protein
MPEAHFGKAPDLFALSGDTRIFALALIHSSHTDEELSQALLLGPVSGRFPAESVLARYAAQAATLNWRVAVAAALATRRRERA